MSSFSFSFGGDDIEETADDFKSLSISPSHAAETGSLSRRRSSSAFPVAGQPSIPAKSHTLQELLATLPSTISYGTLKVVLDDDSEIGITRRELWDVRVQLMAEDEEVGLGKDDVKTGVYEGGFKSWESSVDLVRELAKPDVKPKGRRFLELGCGTALPSLAILQWHLGRKSGEEKLELGFADYNPSVLRLVTVPNLLLTWAQSRELPEGSEEWGSEGELEIDAELLAAFQADLTARGITLNFFSGAWGDEFVQLVEAAPKDAAAELLVLAAETIYSPAALKSFTEVLMQILGKEKAAEALVGAKKVYFGVGGSMEDFCDAVRAKGGVATQIREEEEGVRRAVVKVNTT